MKVCGIDPGNSGGICVLDTNNLSTPALLDLGAVHIYEAGLWMHNQNIDIIFLEDVHSLHGMSAKSNFSFGRNLGVVMTLAQVVMKGQPTNYVHPKVWQKYIGVTAKGTKNIKKNIAKIAMSLYPNADIYGKRGGFKDGKADALMIAHYGINHIP